jgi:transcriptional regulator with XRE-family HTH domain
MWLWTMARRETPALDTLGSRIRTERHALGLSQEALADVAGLHWTFIGQVERGRRNLSFNNLLKIAAALDVDPAELVTGLKPPR